MLRPVANELKRAVGAIMGMSFKSNLYKTQGSLTSKRDKIARNP